MSKDRLVEIDLIKGVLIFLVVVGHVTPKDIGLDWFSNLRSFIYGFHMPVFMMVSGYLFFLSGKHSLASDQVFNYFRKIADRLLVPFFFVGILVVFGKYFSAFFLKVDDPVTNVFTGALRMFVQTSESPVQSIWYLFVLFFCCVITAVFFKKNPWLLFLFSAVLVFFPDWDIFYFDKFKRYYVFFLIGGFVHLYRNWFFRRLYLGCLFLFAFFVSSVAFFGDDFRFIPMGVFGGFAFFCLNGFYKAQSLCFVEGLGKKSMAVYLLNTIAIGVVKGMVLKFYPETSSEILLFVLVVSGILIPLLLSFIVERFSVFLIFRKYLA
ncbi:acyltransferase family protein [Azonexus sp. R2A61]|uniref:acyltransferase family protein n=1 Tax=Azonexus sp. R2A61 TaxID=2744443 RepID=UPI001F2914F7|nr:acyltransferase family protein [Azonexus sp. R2A61]